MTDYEQLGAFYLGKQYDLETRTRRDDLVLYDSRDLTTHAVIIGMTGSGKTGLGVGLLEEAMIDRIPVIAIDPKGDLGNLALRFPSLSASDFRPWVDTQLAANAGLSADDFATKQASSWRDGLAGWGQSSDRVQKLVDSADVTIYTPGSNAGRPISLLRAFAAPPEVVRNDAESFRERIDATATGLLSLLGVEADPITSREHILIANLLSHAWSDGRDLDLPSLIGSIQSPPFAQMGVMPVDTIFPPKDRLALAMRLNNLLAAPGFQNWLQGDALDTAGLLYDAAGKPRASVISIAHLGDAERMFFVTLLLADIIAWMRTQPGTGSLRAILYIDELFGYMPPVANPPSKMLLLTLLKQARAFGLGVVVATQNPVDLDYRGLSNAGTWFIGRLQTERDKMRVMEGLEGASRGHAFDKAAMERTIAGLGKRVFLLHSVHEPAPIVFETRWTLSYLAGPMTREQIRALGQAREAAPGTEQRATTQAQAPRVVDTPAEPIAERTASASAAASASHAGRAPVLPSEIAQYFLHSGSTANITYHPHVIGIADVSYSNTRHDINEQRRVVLLAQADEGPIALDWATAERRDDLDPADFDRMSENSAAFDDLPRAAASPKNYVTWTRQFQQWLVANEQISLWSSSTMKMVSRNGESEREFRIRLQNAAREARDAKVDRLRTKYSSRLAAAQERIRRAEQAVEREAAQAKQAGVDSVISIGSAVLGAIFGRGKIGAGTIGKVGTAARGAGRAAQQRGDVSRATETVQSLRDQYATIEQELQREIDAIGASYDAQTDELESVAIKARRTDVHVQLVGLLWVA